MQKLFFKICLILWGVSTTLSHSKAIEKRAEIPIIKSATHSHVKTQPNYTKQPHVFNGTEISSINDSFKHIKKVVREDQNLDIMQGNKSVFLMSERKQAKGLVIFLHGLTAGTWHFESIGVTLAKQGYHVFAMRLPGHGYKKESNHRRGFIPDQSRFPTGLQGHNDYVAFLERLKKIVRNNKKLNISIVGHSAGGLLAYRLIQQLQDNNQNPIQNAIIIDPFFLPQQKLAKWLINTVYKANQHDFKLPNKILNLIPLTAKDNKLAFTEWDRDGHYTINMNHLYAVALIAKDALKNKSKLSTNIQFTKTFYDDIVDYSGIKQAVATTAHQCIWHFLQDEKIPHSPIHWREIKDSINRKKVETLILDVINQKFLYCNDRVDNERRTAER